MLRITVHENPGILTFQLEGSLVGPWVRLFDECSRQVLARERESALRVDLAGITSIDAAGQACLTTLHQKGADFIATDCLSKAVVQEIKQAAIPVCGRASGTGNRRRKQN